MRTFNEILSEQFLRQVVREPRGRALLLAQCAQAEDSGESRLFDRLAERVQDADLQRMIVRHQADEIRHAALFRDCVGRTGLPLPEVPLQLQAVDRLDRALGGVFDLPVTDDRGVMDAYLLLQVLEERAVTQFPVFQKVFHEVDPVTAATFAEVAKDEERHLLYCDAVSKRYAPDEHTRQRTLRHFREVEALTFAEGNHAVMHHMLDNGLGAFGPISRAAWRALGLVAPRMTRPGLRTRFFTPGRPSVAAT